MAYQTTIRDEHFHFADLREVFARANEVSAGERTIITGYGVLSAGQGNRATHKRRCDDAADGTHPTSRSANRAAFRSARSSISATKSSIDRSRAGSASPGGPSGSSVG